MREVFCNCVFGAEILIEIAKLIGTECCNVMKNLAAIKQILRDHEEILREPGVFMARIDNQNDN